VFKLRAVHPVIAVVILVSVAIAISIAVALWISGLTSSYTSVEKLEIVNAYAESRLDSEGNTYWVVYVIIRNTGTRSATIDAVFINDRSGILSSINYTRLTGTRVNGSGSFTINPGEEYEITFYLNTLSSHMESPVNEVFVSGQTINIVIHTASGGRYPATIQLP
jgi:hypothetical protein